LDNGTPDRDALQRTIATATALLSALGADDESENDAGGESDEQASRPGPYFNGKVPALPNGERFQSTHVMVGNSSSPEGMVICRR
jgi:hypothetical protein